MLKVYFAKYTGKIIKVLSQNKNTTIEEDIQNTPELASYTPDQLDFIMYPDVTSTSALDWFRVNRYTRKLEPTYPILQSVDLQGEQGIPGLPGETGQIGETGKDGLSAYQIALSNGFVGIEKEWLTSLKGEAGKQGERGLTGEKGKDAVLPFKMWTGTAQTNASGVAAITIPPNTFNTIHAVFPSAELNVGKIDEIPNVSIKTYNLTSIQVNVTRFRTLSGLLGLTPTGDFVGAGVKVNVFVIGN